MKNGKKIILIIVIVIIAVLVIIGTTLAITFISIKFFKSDKELFATYFMQNIETISNLANSETVEAYKTLREQETYESNIEVDLGYSEGGEISNPINNLSSKVNIKKDNSAGYVYVDAQILYEDEEYLEGEIISQDNITGVRFSDVTKQFISVREGESNETITNNLEISQSELEDYVNILNGTNFILDTILSQEEINTLKEKYFEIIKNNFENATYQNLKKVMITIDGTTVEANAYSAYLDAGQVGDMVIELLQTLKTDDIILNKVDLIGYDGYEEYIDELINKLSDYTYFRELKITVYQQQGTTIRTDIELGTDEIVIQNTQNSITIQRNVYNTEKEESQTIQIEKISDDNQETYNINIDIIDGDSENSISITNDMQNSEESLVISTKLKIDYGINEIAVTINNTTNKVSELTDKIDIYTNNIILSDLDDETINSILTSLKENVPAKINTRIDLLKQALNLEETTEETDTPVQEEYEMTQAEINKFNAKFEFYTGESVSAENVITLLDVVKDNLSSMEISEIAEEETTSSSSQKTETRITIKLNIEKDVENADLVDEILAKIDEDKKYKVEISYKQDNGIIQEINITELED